MLVLHKILSVIYLLMEKLLPWQVGIRAGTGGPFETLGTFKEFEIADSK